MQKRKFQLKSNAMLVNILLYIAVAIIILVATLVADSLAMPYADKLPAILLTTTEETQSLLSTLAGALLTVTIFLFSTTLVVLTTYSAQLTPRVIENFLDKKSTSQVFGVFIGGTVYCIVALFFMRKTEYSQTFLIAGVAMLYTLLCVVSFIVFIQSVTSSIQVQNLLSSLSKEALEIVDKFVVSRRDTKRTDTFSVSGYQHVYHVRATANGFFEENDVDAIHDLLSGHDCAIILYPRIGDFVSANQHIASLHYNGDALDADTVAHLSEGLILSEKRYIDNDYRFAIQKIVEVALKAMSASINDPNTAIYCIRYLGILTGRLARVDGSYAIVSPKGAGAKVVDQDFLFEKDLRDIYIQLIHYSKEDISVIVALLEALHTAVLVSTPGNKVHIHGMAAYIGDSVRDYFSNPIEAKIIADKMQLVQQKGGRNT
ncbi:MAG: DUF2254 domain-containing protein [Ruminococcaceae bacterium]|nr:DUF2254 domain-containing protein [Oscillospiraceae bacterium]